MSVRRNLIFTLQKINIGVFRVKEIDEDDSIFQQLMEEYRLIGERLEKELDKYPAKLHTLLDGDFTADPLPLSDEDYLTIYRAAYK